MRLARVNAHYQVTIPKAIRNRAKISRGAYVKVEYQAGSS
jgi:AbrB family looped-hinge helix DNA binding protein